MHSSFLFVRTLCIWNTLCWHLDSQLFLIRSMVSLIGGIPGLPHPTWGSWWGLRSQVRDREGRLTSPPYTRPSLMHPRFASLSNHQDPLLTHSPLKPQAENVASLTTSHTGLAWKRTPPASLSAGLRVLRIWWPSKPFWEPLWAAPLVVTNLSSWVSPSEGTATPHLLWETLGLGAWLCQRGDTSWCYFFQVTGQQLCGQEKLLSGLGLRSRSPFEILLSTLSRSHCKITRLDLLKPKQLLTLNEVHGVWITLGDCHPHFINEEVGLREFSLALPQKQPILSSDSSAQRRVSATLIPRQIYENHSFISLFNK